MANQYLVDSPYSPFTIKNQFKAISNGKVYIGEVDKDPLNPSQQIQVYVVDETGSNVPVSQPIQLNAGGYLVYNGQVSKFITLEPYSMVALNNVDSDMWRVDDISKVDPDNITASNVKDTTNGGSVQDFIDTSRFKTVADMKAFQGHVVGNKVEWQGYYTQSDGGSNWGVVKDGAHVEDGGSIFSIDADTYVQANLVGKNLYLKKFGAKMDGSWDDSNAMDAALAYLGTTGSIKLSNTPRFTRKISLNPNSKGFRIYAKSLIQVKCTHNDHGVDMSLTNENFGGNILQNLQIVGPNTFFPASGYVPPSLGSGINLNSAYDTTLINTSSFGFRQGISVFSCYNNKTVGNCQFLYNQIGVLLSGGGYGCNLNKFENAKIRENRVCGVLISGGATGPYPTGNSFRGSYIESNIPYAGGYPVGGPGDGSSSVGVIIDRAYDNDFEGAYFENQEFDIICKNLASGNNFDKTRHAPSSDFSRLGKILLSGAGVNNNSFNQAKQVSRNRTDIHVVTQGTNQFGNEFIDTIGFNFIAGSLETVPYISNNRDFALSGGTTDGTISRPPQGYASNPGEGTTVGKISGIGTATATLYAAGLSEVQLGNQITSPTTITTFNGLKRGSMFIVWNYQIAHPVTIKSGTATGQIVNNGLTDIVLDNYGDSAFYWVNGLGRAVEMGRNLK